MCALIDACSSFPLAGCWNPTQAAEKNEGGTGKGAIADENASGSATSAESI